MSEAKRLRSTPPGVRIGQLDDIADGAARNYVLELNAGRFHGFVVRKGAAAFGYLDVCPHAGLPLAWELDQYLTADKTLINCRWHGALFRIEDGKCVGGPCMGGRLTAWPVEVKDGELFTA
jgi:nitrite reductase/ring-hydroxylating ferredoxin subunit